ncbi:MAG: hypothetical protein KJ558_04980 [Gammaproteobacteria bacterium]|nr:hypothetical protein [Gammaproteobacteria bacterium]MBU1654173.1 hypothetical protein [Gammaproteobacteria bacterium]MBU1961825.1 hypothetical protein [Gammaproteobacteria bacterium]
MAILHLPDAFFLCAAPSRQELRTYDFPSDAQCKAIPYGIYDPVANHTFVNVGTSAATSEFAVASIRLWWQLYGMAHYQNAHHLLVEADAGGCNGHCPRLWKRELQRLADDIGLAITACHYPTGASK